VSIELKSHRHGDGMTVHVQISELYLGQEIGAAGYPVGAQKIIFPYPSQYALE
jgi:hypothetical protein